MLSLWQETNQLLRELAEAEKSARKSGAKAAQMEAEYQMAKYDAVAGMKSRGVPATLISLQVKGVPTVNKALLKRDLAQVEYKSDMELINVLKKRVDTYREQMQREWSTRQP